MLTRIARRQLKPEIAGWPALEREIVRGRPFEGVAHGPVGEKQGRCGGVEGVVEVDSPEDELRQEDLLVQAQGCHGCVGGVGGGRQHLRLEPHLVVDDNCSHLRG
jgi:hypothetical protein